MTAMKIFIFRRWPFTAATVRETCCLQCMRGAHAPILRGPRTAHISRTANFTNSVSLDALFASGQQSWTTLPAGCSWPVCGSTIERSRGQSSRGRSYGAMDRARLRECVCRAALCAARGHEERQPGHMERSHGM